MRKLSIKDIINYVSEDPVYNIVCVDNAFEFEAKKVIATPGGNWTFTGKELAIGKGIVWMRGRASDWWWREEEGRKKIMMSISWAIERAVERGEMKNVVNIEDVFNLDLKMAVFHHHDLTTAFIKGEDGTEFYEFSHIDDNVFYQALLHGDVRFISALLKRKFLEEKVVLVEEHDNEDLYYKRHWLYDWLTTVKMKNSEELQGRGLLWKVKLLLGPKEVVPDPKRRRKEHEKIKSPVVMYKIPSLFGEVEVE